MDEKLKALDDRSFNTVNGKYCCNELKMKKFNVIENNVSIP